MKPCAFLMVDDNEDDAFLVRRAFARAAPEHQLGIVGSCEEAVAYLSGEGEFADRKRHPVPEIVLVDGVLPCEGGMELVKWLRGQPDYRQMIIIMFSGSGAPQKVRDAYEGGVNSYLEKPSGTAEMEELIRCVCDYWLKCSLLP